MAEDKVITLGPNELPNLVSSYCLDDRNYLQWVQYICTTLKGYKKLSHIEENGLPRNDPNKIFNYRQETLSVTKYYGTLNGLWIELDQYQGLKMCKADYIAYTGLIERRRIFKFLHGLNFEYNPIQSEETRQVVMLDKGNSNIKSAMVIGKGPTKRSTFEGKPFTKSSHGEYYMYCKRLGHTKDTYYKLYGKEKYLE
ncbi:hypothetical protein CR513_16155, partial [Mucuna pruriens]